LFQYLLLCVECVSYRKKVNASVPIIPIVCAMLSTSENTISEIINVSISVDTKDQPIFHVLFLLMHDKCSHHAKGDCGIGLGLVHFFGVVRKVCPLL
jgi:hypothetical protein